MSDFLQSDVGFTLQGAAGVLLVGLVALAVVAALGGRDEPDPRGDRARTLYLTSVSLAAIVTVLVAGFGLLRPAFAALIEDDDSAFVDDSFDLGGFGEFEDFGEPFPSEGHDADDQRWAAAASNGLVLVAALTVLVFHRRRLDALEERTVVREGGGWRTHLAYLYFVSFVAALVALFAAASAGFDVFRLIAPGVTGLDDDVERRAAAAHLLAVGALGVVAAWLWRDHFDEAEAITGRTGETRAPGWSPSPGPEEIPPGPPTGPDPSGPEPASPPS